jgi:hypothetical protein
MAERVEEFVPNACRHCGGTGAIRAVNPVWLRARRHAAGVSQRALSRSVQFSAMYLCDIEHGRARGAGANP